jgi:hypothetical protein
MEKLTQLFEKMNSRYEKKLSASSIKNYSQKLNRIFMLVDGKPFSGSFDALKNPKKVVKIITDSDLSSKKDYITPIVRVLKSLPNIDESVIEDYGKAMLGFKKEEGDLRKKNTKSDKDRDLMVPLNEIKKKIEEFKVTDDMSLIFKLICSLYFMNTLVPRNDLNVMKFASSKKKLKELSKDFNFILLNPQGNPTKIVMQRFKTDNTFGSVSFEITEFCKNILKQYIKAYGKVNGDFVFVMSDGARPFEKGNMSDLVKKSMQAVVGLPLNINMIRKIQITDYYSNGPTSIEQDQLDARRYLHGTTVHKEYLRIPSEGDDE